ncbi:YheC/YheD family protein [Paenibacillus hamazuiensis]|uniref:YheC/YheD family endospore coat-associated protein n=1 Tax=Paenibacillus hamazuiensis TaxID=2936508 RepID=UPI0020104AF7|nr:YheC/YheD family protein [Paenibacillus hamazuiensis]
MPEMLRQRFLGIMTSPAEGEIPFRNRGFYRQLCLLGAKAGLAVYVFSPQDVDWMTRTTAGYAYDAAAGSWCKRRFPLPDAVYDRCFFSGRKQYLEYRKQVRRLSGAGIAFLGVGLGGKWDVHRMLLRERELAPYLPETTPYAGPKTLEAWFGRHDDAFLKPLAGSQGKGALHVHKDKASGLYLINGRDRHNRTVQLTIAGFTQLQLWLERFIRGRSYLLQRYLALTTPEGEAFDVRSLVQKDGSGRWRLTGMAVRRGRPGSVTSNLHGGGDVAEMMPFLAAQFGETHAGRIAAELAALSRRLPPALERRHGRLAELGLDFGIDAAGRVWFLEANSKPGRSIFARLNDSEARLNALASPIRYAGYLIKRTWNGADIRKLGLEEAPYFPRRSTGGQS